MPARSIDVEVGAVVLVGLDETDERRLAEAFARIGWGNVELRRVESCTSVWNEVHGGRSPVVVAGLYEPRRTPELEHMVERLVEESSGAMVVVSVRAGTREAVEFLIEKGALDYFTEDDDVERIATIFRNAAQMIGYYVNFRELNEIGVALFKEHDLNSLLELALLKARTITNSDAGSLYLKMEDENGQPYLLFKVAQTYSMESSYKEFKMPISRRSIAGYVADTGNIVNIEDCYALPPDCEYRFDAKWDKMSGYRTKSMLAVPMRNHANEVIGVIQLINRKKRWHDRLTLENTEELVIPYEKEYIDMALSVAAQAGVSIENTQLIKSIENLFFGFVKASAQAIEARDKSTSGHSDRIKDYALAIARRMNELTEGPFKDVYFTEEELKELEYASILHDIGKIGVREEVLVKATRLNKHQLNVIKYRLNYYKASLREKAFRDYLKKLSAGEIQFLGDDELDYREELEKKLRRMMEKIDEYIAFIEEINTAGFLPDDKLEKLKEIRSHKLVDIDGREKPFLTDEEYESLSVRRGNLTPSEREEINSHVVHTYNILSKIPWHKSLARVPLIASSHHERNDGSGYPRGLTRDELLLQSRILALVDVYEALTATDRPYKPAMPVEKALSIIREEADRNRLDPDIADLFIGEQLYKVVDLEKQKQKEEEGRRRPSEGNA